jgi:hypothetical protein
MLHAAVLGFVHPVTGAYVEYRVRPPADMEHALVERRRASRVTVPPDD